MSRSTCLFALLAVAAGLAIAGCGGGSGGGSSSESTAASAEGGGAYAPPASGAGEEKPASEGGEATNVSLGSGGNLGLVLVDSKGFALYDFHKDKGGKPACYGACAEAWPPLLTTGMPQPGNGASASMLGTVKRKDGTMQVTYAGHPLYTFIEDKKPGEANGNDAKAFGGQWYALKGNGEEAEG